MVIMTTFSCVFRFDPIVGDEVRYSLDCHPDIRAVKRLRMQWHPSFLHPTSLSGLFLSFPYLSQTTNSRTVAVLFFFAPRSRA
jgi:hypothetical protein